MNYNPNIASRHRAQRPLAKELKNKYEAIETADRTPPQAAFLAKASCPMKMHGPSYQLSQNSHFRITIEYLRLINKFAEKIKELEGLHSEINEIYSNGAVEGYSDANLGLPVILPLVYINYSFNS